MFLMCWLMLFADEGAWDKVRAVEAGTDLRIFKRDVKAPVIARMDEATDDHLIVLLQDSQVAIRRAEIDRIDRRPRGARVTRVSKHAHRVGGNPGEQGQPVVQGTSASSAVANAARTDTLTFRSKAPFEFLYRRVTSN